MTRFWAWRDEPLCAARVIPYQMAHFVTRRVCVARRYVSVMFVVVRVVLFRVFDSFLNLFRAIPSSLIFLVV